ncbi:MAG: HNH endonuclease [bacterium]|nr:HNH endonuclease [bacterium]
MGKQKRHVGRCVYCGHSGMVTRDHVPPRGLFPSALRGDLPIVDSCRACNQSYAHDIEYVRDCLALDEDVGSTPYGVALFEVARRNARRGFGPARGLIRDAERVEVLSPEGVVLGERFQVGIDRGRILHVVRRTVQGLWAHHIGQVLPPELTVNCWMAGEVADVVLGEEEPWMSLREEITSAPLMSLAKGAFGYRFVVVPDHSEASIWFLHFYSAKTFIGITLNEEVAEARRREQRETS